MSEPILIQSSGQGTLTLANYLRENDSKYDRCTDWSAYSTASLILFFKILGKTSTQIVHLLEQFKLLGDFFPYNSIVTQPAAKNREYIKEYLLSHLEGSLFDRSSTMGDVRKVLGIDAKFILYNSRLVRTNSESNLLNSVLSSLCSPSVYNSYDSYSCGITVYPVVNDFKGVYIISKPVKMTVGKPTAFNGIEGLLFDDYVRRLEACQPVDAIVLEYTLSK
jgi:hypothetical protein